MSAKQATPGHPGPYVREHVLPAGLTITDAARMLDVGRPALSNFLNGKAALSPEMALRLEKAFGADRPKLLDMQAQYDRQADRVKESQVAVRSYVPALMKIEARDIEGWADGNIEARRELPALLRMLVHSTASDLRQIDFPAYDNAERKGWDGIVDAVAATPWIPEGRSGWEFGCNKEPAAKANKDFAARVASVPKDERADTVFVFVTPRNWQGKSAWVKEKKVLGEWKDVRAFDASDLEQWLEQSIPGQIWLAEKLGRPVTSYRSLDECWLRWSMASDPPLVPEIFAPAVAAYRETFRNWLEAAPSRPFIVAADSKEEALSYLACLVRDEQLASTPFQDLPVIFDTADALRILAAASAPFIPVVHTTDAERELAPLYRNRHCIVVRPRNAVDSDPDITLDLLRQDDFVKALAAMKIEEEEAKRLALVSARSPTILRRLLSKIDAIRSPHWAENAEVARHLVPMALAGAWHAGSKSDCEVISLLAGRPYEAVEESVAALHRFDDTPLWSAGKFIGVTSKADALFALGKSVIRKDVEDFFFVAELVLSERDPKLDLPEEDRWAAGIYGKLRDHSAAIRAGIRESLVILAIHGNRLFGDRIGIDVETQVRLLIRRLLSPLTLEKLLSHNYDLPHYAEASPEEFLNLIDGDLARNDPVLFELLKPVDTSGFGADCPRTGLLWAMENLAWKPENLPRVVTILAKLSAKKIDDNWANKPDASLQAIFRSWMPQTAASLDQRIQALDLLVKRFPEVGWEIATEQFEVGSRIGHYSHRPSWRSDASGAGQPLAGERQRENFAFIRHAVKLALGWPQHNERTLGDLVERLEALSDEHQAAVWDLIDIWAGSNPGENEKAALRERIRRFAFTRRGQKRNLRSATRDRAGEALAQLAPSDPVVRHRWLFANTWVEESLDEIQGGDFDYKKREERIQNERLKALREIWASRGFESLSVLLASSGAPHVAGYVMAEIVTEHALRIRFVADCLAAAKGDLEAKFKECLRGFFLKVDPTTADQITAAIAKTATPEVALTLYLCMPFGNETWRRLDDAPEELRRGYWANVSTHWGKFTPDETNELIDALLDTHRPAAAFHAVHLDWANIETSRLKRLLMALATTADEKPTPYRFQQYEISEAFKTLGKRAGISVDEMAHLEFMYLKALDHSEHGIPNLEKQIARSPERYVEAVALTFKRSDDKEDPPQWRIDDPDSRSRIASGTYTLLTTISRIPGTSDDDAINVHALKAWLSEVRAACAQHGRIAIADQMIGQLLSKAPAGADGVWPCEPVREALEWMSSPEVARGFEVGTYNSRGAHWRGEGGGEERGLAARYRGFSQKLAFEYPYVASVMESIAASYDRDAKWEDTDARVRSRLPY